MRPSVSINLSNGGLGLLGIPAYGACGLLIASTAAPVAGYGVPFLIKSKNDAAIAFAQVNNAPLLAAITTRFFGEASDGTALYIMCMADTTTMATLLLPANADKVLTLANGAVRRLGVIRYPAVGYTPTVTNGFDQDVHDAVIAAQTLATNWLAYKKPIRIFIQAMSFVSATAAKDYSTDTKRNVCVVVFNINANNQDALLLCLGRSSKIGPQRNIGRIKDGSLNIPQTDLVKIGAVLVENVPASDLELLWSKRYISVERNEIASGYVFTDDLTLTAPTDDFNNLANGLVIDNATRIAYATYYLQLKDDVNVDAGGRLSPVVEKALENAIKSALDVNMRSQLSTKKDGTADVDCLVNPDAVTYAPLYAANNISTPNFNILQTGQVYLFLQVRPKGCLRTLTVYLGFTH